MLSLTRITEKSRLIVSQDSSQEIKPSKIPWTIPLFVLVFLQFAGLPGLVLYCIQTFSCGKNMKHPHYNCANGTFVAFDTAMMVELAFACSEVLSRTIFICFCLKLKGWKGILKTFWRLCKVARMWFLALICSLCIVRFGSILCWVTDLGNIVKAIIGVYIVDALEITIVVATLHDVKVEDLTEDNLGIAKRKHLTLLFRCVLVSFWLQYFVYLIIVSFQLAFDVSEVDPEFVREDFKRALNLLRKSAQFVFMNQISGQLWSALFADNRARTNKNKEITQRNELELMEAGDWG